ncbi:MAG: LPXTG cell wall anchor domain-containing protein [Eubacteriaceae bacterium]|nr:LPXTG cell wall anchor domain-containing protein [Eubacteriaceae bacterium]
MESRTCERCQKTGTKEFFYILVEADAKQWIMGSTEDITYTFKRSIEDEKTFDSLTGVLVDGKAVSEEFFTVEAGSAVVTLKASYLATLGAGKHTMTVTFTDGSRNAPFYVIDPSVPATGTGSGMVFWMIAIVCALASMIMIFIRRKRMRTELK